MRDFLDSDKHLVIFVLLIFLGVYMYNNSEVMTRFLDTLLGAFITLLVKSERKENDNPIRNLEGSKMDR